jgi:hypothetical protein
MNSRKNICHGKRGEGWEGGMKKGLQRKHMQYFQKAYTDCNRKKFSDKIFYE